MARVLFTAVVADMRNKLNGTVFSKNKAGAYTRTKVTPVNPQSASQIASRQRLSQFSNEFRNLTASQVAAWNDFARNNAQGTDIFGNPKYLSGLSTFVRLNSNLAIANADIILDPPPLVSPLALSITAASTEITAGVLSKSSVTISPGVLTATSVAVYATPSYPVSQTYNTNRFRLIKVVTNPSSGLINCTAEYLARFGTPVLGQKVSYYVESISTVSGFRVLGAEMLTIVEPGT